jgi:hypothetical protein
MYGTGLSSAYCIQSWLGSLVKGGKDLFFSALNSVFGQETAFEVKKNKPAPFPKPE